MSAHWYDQQKTYYAKRLKKMNPFFPENRVIFFERDERHAGPNNLRGHLVIAEGRTFRAYPTPAIKRLVGTLIEEVSAGAAPRATHVPAPDSITAIIDDEGLVAVLERHGVDTVPVLVEHWVSGRLDDVKGIGAARKAKLRSALLEGGFIRVDAEDLGE